MYNIFYYLTGLISFIPVHLQNNLCCSAQCFKISFYISQIRVRYGWTTIIQPWFYLTTSCPPAEETTYELVCRLVATVLLHIAIHSHRRENIWCCFVAFVWFMIIANCFVMFFSLDNKALKTHSLNMIYTTYFNSPVALQEAQEYRFLGSTPR